MELKPVACKTKDGFIIQQTGQVFLISGRDVWEIVSPDHLPNFYLGEHGSAEEALAALHHAQGKHPFLFGREAGCSQ